VKAYAYLRVSGQDQVEKDGLERQRLAVELFAHQRGIKIAKVYREEGVTGTIETRPALADLMEEMQPGDTVIIEKLDRLARDLMVQEAIFARFLKAEVTLLSAVEPDLSGKDPTRKFVRQVLGAVAELDKALIVARMRVARDRIRAKTGRCEGRKPYGHRAGEADTAAGIRLMARQGQSYTAIAAHLNANGIAARCGGLWHVNAVRRIVVREAGR
jgi:DNA invertase Pin-like site-specific DNA recombinase